MKKDQDNPVLARKLLEIARWIEWNGVEKLNCMFIAAWRLSLPSVQVLINE